MLEQKIEAGTEGTIDEDAGALPPPDAEEIIQLMLDMMADGLDHPELWPMVSGFIEHLPHLPAVATVWYQYETQAKTRLGLAIINAMCRAALGEPAAALAELEPLGVRHSQSPLVQGAIFYLHGLLDPDNPKYRLEGKICPTPFQQMDVLERSTHLCCASWLQTSAGDLSNADWEDVWNSEAAQAIRASIHDGSYRHCNKMACPKIHRNDLTEAAEVIAKSDRRVHTTGLASAGELASRSDDWRAIIETQATELPYGPHVVNLAYDRTCNLSCPSCRTAKFAADAEMRDRFDAMQQRSILPMLRQAKTVMITGSGDPFASKNFRRLMEQLGPDDYPDLRFQVMTNGMLFNRREWERFPALHGRIKVLKISIDAATGPTHELLRRGARWPTMLENMAFYGELRAQGLIDYYELVFTVQAENYREMGDACDLARQVGANGIFFARMTNWGTFSDEEYRDKAVFLPSHPEHSRFLEAMADPRLLAPMVQLGDLQAFVPEEAPAAAA